MDQCKANFPLYANINTVKTTGLWLKTFQNTPDDVMQTAVNLCLLSCKSFPTVADIRGAIDELKRELNTQPNTRILPPRTRRVVMDIVNALEMLKTGKTKELLASMDVTDVYEYTKSQFPDVTEDFVRRNYNRLLETMESNARCFGCQHTDGKCDTAGYYIVSRIMKDGSVKNEYQRCGKGRAAS